MIWCAGCQPYSEQACRHAATALGLQLGSTASPFAGKFTQKGCYAYSSGKYAGQAYYGTGGTAEDMQKEVASNAYRPNNYDCDGNHIYTVHAFMCLYACEYSHIQQCLANTRICVRVCICVRPALLSVTCFVFTHQFAK